MEYLTKEGKFKQTNKILKYSDIFFNNSIIISPKDLITHFMLQGRIDKKSVNEIVLKAIQIFEKEPNLLYLQDPVSIIGDIHGQFYDIPTILNLIGSLDSNNKYLFLGDYVDRGSFGFEVIITLYFLKIHFPTQIFLLRGNHECVELTNYYNFKKEVLYKADSDIYQLLIDSFNMMPIGCLINGIFLAVHGGLSPELTDLESINKINRKCEPPKDGLLCDILWSDPVEDMFGNCKEEYFYNDSRGCSYYFGYEAVEKFLKNNDILCIIRAHEAENEGYKMHLWGKCGPNLFPQVITIFSAPNYCGSYGNKGAVARIVNNKIDIYQLTNIEHPKVLPNFENLFKWSIPYITEISTITS